MSEQNFCNSCKKNLNKNEFTLENKIYKTCNICREQRNKKRQKNICEECGIYGIFNFEGEFYGKFCKKHAKIGMIDVKHKKCEYNGCKKRPTYNFENDKPKFCFLHKEEKMIDVSNKRCAYIDCKKQPTYNFENEIKPKFCFLHKEENMIDVLNMRCKYLDCKKQPTYNFEGEIRGIFCSEHKEEAMIDVLNNKCEYIGCKKNPSCNFEDEKKARFCSEHKKETMINILNNKCEYIGCKKISYFNFENEKKGKFCSEHKQKDMIDVKNKTCEQEGCKKNPAYNFKGETRRRFCFDHKKENMINIMCIICEYENCETQATFGYINQPATHCTRHKSPLMFKKRKVKCQEENCKEISEYGVEEPTHCFLHQKENHLCLLGQTCVNCHRKNELCNKEQICLTYCRPTELSITAKKIVKKKEGLVLSYLDKNIKSDINPIDDKIIDTSCVKRRPDRVYDCSLYFLVIEVDENQHKSYSNGCSFDIKTQELRRMVQIHEALSNGMMPVIFLRFNPDNFRVKGNLQKVNMQKRLEILCKWVNYCLNLKEKDLSTNQIRIKHLFYDEYDETNIDFEDIDDMKSLI